MREYNFYKLLGILTIPTLSFGSSPKFIPIDRKMKGILQLKKRSKVVYEISYACECDKVYVGEVRQRLTPGSNLENPEHLQQRGNGTCHGLQRKCKDEPSPRIQKPLAEGRGA